MFADLDDSRTLIDELLDEQQRLTAVERFARRHEADAPPAQSRYYRDLIPLTKPQPGEQYAFAVDMDICTGCKACVSACHSLNGLDDDELWRDVGLLHGGTVDEPYQQTVTTACHHCVDPACLNGCPVCAYEKDRETGIVRHLDDQCIGCQYCVLKCPYDVPKYSEKRGIVRKCDMCHGRLSAGEAPACVQSCPSGAIAIRIVRQAELVDSMDPGDRLIPGAFFSEYTKPTTTYKTCRPMPANARPGDDAALRLEHPHWPLIGMLVLTQIAVGMLTGAAGLAFGADEVFHAVQTPLTRTAFAILNLGLLVSIAHLGRPLGAWRFFLGLRTSWMSREILVFSLFAGAAGAFTGACVWHDLAPGIAKIPGHQYLPSPEPFLHPLALATSALGLLGVFCSAMIYVDTRRSFWSGELVFTKFFGTTFLLGTAGVAVILAWVGISAPASVTETARLFLGMATVAGGALLGWESQHFRRALAGEAAPDHRSAQIMWHLRRPLLVGRVALFAGAMILSLFAIPEGGIRLAAMATLSGLLLCGAQLIERYFFFTAVVALRMPGPLVPEPPIHA